MQQIMSKGLSRGGFLGPKVTLNVFNQRLRARESIEACADRKLTRYTVNGMPSSSVKIALLNAGTDEFTFILVCRRQSHLLCLNIPGMSILLGQPSQKKQAAQLVQVLCASSFVWAKMYRLCSLLSPMLVCADADGMQIGMDSFRRGNVASSVNEFDEALRLDPTLRPYLWQRGLSLFYAGALHASLL